MKIFRFRLWDRLKDSGGNVSILTIGFMVLILMAIGVGVAITGLEVDRNRVQFIADGSTLYAASAFNEDGTYVKGVRAEDLRSKPSDQEVEQRVLDFLARQGEYQRIESIQVVDVQVSADSSVTVVLEARVHPPLLEWFTRGALGPVSFQVESTGFAW